MKLKQCSDIQYMTRGSIFDMGSAARESSLVRILEGDANHILAIACCLLLFQPLAEVLDALRGNVRGGEVGGRCVSEGRCG